MKKILLFVLLCASLSGLGQKFCEFNVYFETAEWKIEPSEQKKIDSVLGRIGHGVKFDIKATGHTDKRGGKKYNQNLSEKRAQAVTDYMTKKVEHRELNKVGKAFTDMVYTGDDVNAFGRNRRVKVELYYTIPEVKSIGAEKPVKEKFLTDNSQNDTLLTKSGTRIFIPANGFVFEDGSPVTGSVNIGYTEYRDPIDFILGGIPMGHTENGQPYIFNSSGMFKIEGSQAGKKLLIKEGKEIGIDFAKTQDVPNTNFYSFDSTMHWTNIGEVNSQANDHLADARKSCLMQTCDALAYLGVESMNLINSGSQVYSEVIANNSYRDQDVVRLAARFKKYSIINKNSKKNIDSLAREHSQTYNTYRLETIEQNDALKTVKFRIVCRDCNINPFELLEGNVWEYRYENKKNTERFLDIGLVYCALSNIKKDGTVSLKMLEQSKRKRKATFKNVRAVNGLTDDSKKAIDEMMGSYRNERRNVYKQRYEIEKLQNRELVNVTMSSIVLDSIRYYMNKPLDTRNEIAPRCFYKQSMRMVALADEKEMPELVWYRYFEKNPGLMRDRYEALTDEKKLANACKVARQRDSTEAIKRGVTAYADTKFRAMQASLGIGSFGVYNCDQLERIKNPVDILAAYEDENENKMEIASVFMIDHSINSVLTFNGYMGLWPEHFSYGKNSQNTIIAFDKAGVAYICKSPEFAKAVHTPGATKIFPLRRIGSEETKKEILAATK